jgi:hypothetical protein
MAPSSKPTPSSNVDMLRLEYPRSLDDVTHDRMIENDTVEIKNPADWARMMINYHHQAQRDLRTLYEACGKQFTRDDYRLRQIEHNYEALFEGCKYLYETQATQTAIGQEWLRTELRAIAGAAQAFSSDVWAVLNEKATDDSQRAAAQAQAIIRMNDALMFLQTADEQRLKEQAQYRSNLETWATAQQAATAKLAKKQDKLASEMAKTKKAIREVSVRGRAPRERTPPWARRRESTSSSETPHTAPGGSGAPPRPPPPPRVPAGGPPSDSEPSDDDLGPSPSPPPRRPRETRASPRPSDAEEERFARVIANAVQFAQQGVQKFRLTNPKTFDGKPSTPFRPWWNSVEEYIGFYPATNDYQRIVWLGTLLTDEALEWHQSRRMTLRRHDTWQAYTEAIREEYLDPTEASESLRQMSALRYKGNIKAYMTTLRALNLRAHATGEPLMALVDKAMPDSIIDMRFAQNPVIFSEDDPFLRATYEAGRHVERRDDRKKERERQGNGNGGSGGPSSSGSSKESGKGPKGQGKKKEDHRPKGESSRGGQSGARTGKEEGIWDNMKAALDGVTQKEIDTHKKSGGCMRCGREGHRALACYAAKTIGNTPLPPAPRKVAGANKRKRGTDDPSGTPKSKAPRTAAVDVQNEETQEAPPVWAEGSDDEQDFY